MRTPLSARNDELLALLQAGVAAPAPVPRDTPAFLSEHRYPVSPWPILIDAGTVERELEPLAAAMPRILLQALLRTFGSDAQAFETYFGYPRLVYELLQWRPLELDEVLLRYDAVFTQGAAVLLEANCSSSLGGWPLDWHAPAIRGTLRGNARTAAWDLHHRRPSDAILALLIRGMLRRGGRGNIALHCFAQTDAGRASLQRALDDAYAALRPPQWRDARILLFTDFAQLDVSRRDALHVHGVPVDALLMSFPPEPGVPDALVERLLELHCAGRLFYPDSPMHHLLGDKRVFALAQQCAERGLLSAADSALVRRHLPWTQRVEHATATWREQVSLPQLLRRERERFVLKHAGSYAGRDVVIGRATSADAWRSALEHALQTNCWIAQEFHAPCRAVLPDATHGCTHHELVWGFFAAGANYAGAFVRALRGDLPGRVINAANGATEFLVFEDGGAALAAAAPTPHPQAAPTSTQNGAPAMDFSPLNERLLQRLHASPDMRAETLPVDRSDTAHFASENAAAVSPWPVFVSRDIVETTFAEVVERTPRLLYKALFAYFRQDADAFARYFGWPAQVYQGLLANPPDTRDLLGRYDVVFVGGQAKIIEFNCSSAAGGWQIDWLQPLVAAALSRHGLDDGKAAHRAVFENIAQHMVRAILRRKPDCTRGNILLYSFVSSDARMQSLRASLQAVYDRVKPPQFGAGRVYLFRDFDAIEFGADGGVRFDGADIDAVMFTFPTALAVPDAVYAGLDAAHRARRVMFPDCAAHFILDSKLLFAIVHACAERGLLTHEERRWMRRFVPWTASLADDFVHWRGERHALAQLVAERQRDLVLKKADSAGGKHVVVGRYVSDADWRRALAAGREEHGWIVQEFCAPDPFLAPHPREGVCEHDLVWGVFGVGRHYGGAMVRARTRTQTDGVVNLANGATEFLVYEELA